MNCVASDDEVEKALKTEIGMDLSDLKLTSSRPANEEKQNITMITQDPHAQTIIDEGKI